MSPSLRASVRRVLCVAGVIAATSAVAEPQSTAGSTVDEIVIVTGSYLRGTAEDAALPVDVITADDLQKQGAPGMVDILKAVPAVQAVIGEANQFGSGQSAGAGSVNLRGLGGVRTLVLLNGRRLAPIPTTTTTTGVDTNLIPIAALSRIEVLKDGAAATYGSDAIGGVINFITKENFDGLDLTGSYSYIEGSDGDYDANIAWGYNVGSGHGLVSAGYRHRSELNTQERDWAVRSITENPQGGYSLAGNPGVFSTGTGASIVDPACTAVGGTVLGSCRFQFIPFFNIVEEEEHYQLYTDYNMDITDSVALHVEGLYATNDVQAEAASPSYAPNQGPAGGALPSYFVPLANPGIQALLNNANSGLTPAQRAAITGSTVGGVPGVNFSGLSWRPLAQGGNPEYGGGGLENERKFNAFRVNVGLSGDIGDSMNWQTAATYMEDKGEISTPDFLVSRLGLALRGLGGPNCVGTTPGQNGCQWLNPVSSGVPFNAATGQVNNLTYQPGTEPSADLIRWISTDNSFEATTSLLVVDAVVSGESGIPLPGGNIGWAVGAQYRDNGFEREVTDDFANIALNPCADTPVNGSMSCTSQTGALSFYGPISEVDVSQDLYAVFTEISLPILDTLNAQLAVRYEDYGGGIGDTTDPKLAVRWQALDWLALRASAGTTFRAPPQTSVTPGFTTGLAFIYGNYKAFDTFGNPDLKPEKADTFNVGFIVKAGNFNATLDYFNFKFKDQLTTESGTQLVTAFFGPTGATDHCGDPAFAGLQARFTFAGACSAANLIRVRQNNINALTDVTVSGVDLGTYYQFENVMGGDLTVGLDATYNIEYDIGANIVAGVLIDPAQDVIGTRGGRGTGAALAELKGGVFIDYARGIHNARLTGHYIGGVDDVRATILANTPGKNVDAFKSYDLSYRVKLPANLTASATVFNLTDEDPPFARLDLSYDPLQGANPVGRIVKVGVMKSF